MASTPRGKYWLACFLVGATILIAGDIESEGLTSQPGAIASVVRRVFGDHNAITVRGQGDMLVYRARCCNPIRGEIIVVRHHPRQGRRRALRGLSQCHESSVRAGAQDRCRMGPR